MPTCSSWPLNAHFIELSLIKVNDHTDLLNNNHLDGSGPFKTIFYSLSY